MIIPPGWGWPHATGEPVPVRATPDRWPITSASTRRSVSGPCRAGPHGDGVAHRVHHRRRVRRHPRPRGARADRRPAGRRQVRPVQPGVHAPRGPHRCPALPVHGPRRVRGGPARGTGEVGPRGRTPTPVDARVAAIPTGPAAEPPTDPGGRPCADTEAAVQPVPAPPAWAGPARRRPAYTGRLFPRQVPTPRNVTVPSHSGLLEARAAPETPENETAPGSRKRIPRSALTRTARRPRSLREQA